MSDIEQHYSLPVADCNLNDKSAAACVISRGRWTDEEHQKFLVGLNLYGNTWRKIESLVQTRTAVQIRTHAQKYFQKLNRHSGSEDFTDAECYSSASSDDQESKRQKCSHESSNAGSPDEYFFDMSLNNDSLSMPKHLDDTFFNENLDMEIKASSLRQNDLSFDVDNKYSDSEAFQCSKTNIWIEDIDYNALDLFCGL